MKRVLCLVLLVATGFAAADELGDANRLLANKSYDKALPIYQRLAEAGNADAQFRLGEMYWFGDVSKPDLVTAEKWFRKSAAAGSADAVASLASLKRREIRGNEIVYWTTTYQGEDLISGKLACAAPTLPTVSKSASQIKTVAASMSTWHECYNRFVTNVNALLPAGKAIPADVVDMMTPAEAQQAQRHLDQVYSKVIANAQRNADVIIAQENAWVETTQQYVIGAQSRNELRNAWHDHMNRTNDSGPTMTPDRYVQTITVTGTKR
jgi:TPR repeat protein